MAHVEGLSAEEKQFGKDLWDALRRQSAFPVTGALWLFDAERSGWKLVIASPRVEEIGARDSYRELAEATKAIPATGAQLLQIELVGPNDPTYTALRSVFGQAYSVEGARLNHSLVNGIFVEDAYLYEVR